MCTVSYIPAGKNSFYLTSNRDEKAGRPTIEPLPYRLGDQSLLFPKDEFAGGTWIVAAENGYCASLLNGGLKKHKRTPPYRKSRGLTLLDLFKFEHIEDFCLDYNFSGIEPFTIVWAGNNELFELRWTGKYKSLTPLNPRKAYIWSSVTLYPNEISELRKEKFKVWYEKQKQHNQQSIIEFHAKTKLGDPANDLVMKRGGEIQTVSITSIFRQKESTTMSYHDLLNSIASFEKITLAKRALIKN